MSGIASIVVGSVLSKALAPVGDAVAHTLADTVGGEAAEVIGGATTTIAGKTVQVTPKDLLADHAARAAEEAPTSASDVTLAA